MKTPAQSRSRAGFTLMELMVAMAITVIIVTVLVSITSIAMDTWNRSRAELRASRQGKAMVDSLARDLESLVTRRGNEFEWLSAIRSIPEGSSLQSTNASELVFFSASTDRYNGEIGGAKDEGGDVSCVAYLLDYKDPIEDGGTKFRTFVLNRLLIDPKPTFEKLLGQKTLNGLVNKEDIKKIENFVCENVYQFTVTFHVEATTTGSDNKPVIKNVPITVGSSGVTEFKIKGTGMEATGTVSGLTADELKAARLKAVEISLTILSDAGIDQLRNRGFSQGEQEKEFLARNSYNYSKMVQLPTM